MNKTIHRALIIGGLALAGAACASSSEQAAKTGVDQAKQEIDSAPADADKNVEYGKDSVKEEVKTDDPKAKNESR